MKTRLLALALAIAPMTAIALPSAATAQSRAEEARFRAAERRFNYEREVFERERARYDAARRYRGGGSSGYYDDRYRWDGGRDNWDGARYYREDSRYEERALSAQDEVYRGSDGRYYCRRSDGTTGLVVGAGAGALLGRAVDGGRNRAGGTIVGGVLGALIGREIERSNDVRCR